MRGHLEISRDFVVAMHAAHIRHHLRRGLILARGSCMRLHQINQAPGKLLLPVFQKPIIDDSLSTLLLAGIREALITIKHLDQQAYQRPTPGTNTSSPDLATASR